MNKGIYILNKKERFHKSINLITLIEEILSNKNKPKIIYWENFHEYEFPYANHNTTIEISYVDYLLRKNDVKLYMGIGCENQDRFLDYLHFTNIKFIFFPTYFFNYYDSLNKNLQQKQKEIENIENFDSLFINLNGRAHIHRCYLMDELKKKDVLKYGNYTWNEINPSYEFKYWNQSIQKFDEYPPKDDSFKSHVNLLNFKNPLINVVTESNVELFRITEKTVKPILLKQIFILLGTKNQNHMLKNYGFELYDEIFDYSFDKKETLKERVEGLVDNLLKIKDKDYRELYEIVKPKLKRNYQTALYIKNNQSLIPNEYLNLYLLFKSDFLKEINNGSIEEIIKKEITFDHKQTYEFFSESFEKQKQKLF